jgi:serine-type D-Ala-D-Ala carboxypeptidase (penicillin-binding protein 5/6)
MPYTLFQGGRRRRRRWPARLAVVATLAAVVAATLLVNPEPQAERTAQPAPVPVAEPTPLPGGSTAPSPLAVRLGELDDPVRHTFKRPPRAALLFDLDTGKVLWRRAPTKVMPIASLTKLMTALVVAERLPRGTKVPITADALDFAGSGVGLLPLGKRVGTEALLHGLMLVSGNDAATALAQGAAGGSVRRFVSIMNRRARRMGLTCTRFSNPSGIEDRGNHSCAADVAALARATMRVPRIARIAGRREAALRFPVKGGRLYLYNTNPLLRQGYRGVTGLKTGYTRAAGRCLVATARRGDVRLGVVLLGAPDPGRQAVRLLDKGFRVAG